MTHELDLIVNLQIGQSVRSPCVQNPRILYAAHETAGRVDFASFWTQPARMELQWLRDVAVAVEANPAALRVDRKLHLEQDGWESRSAHSSLTFESRNRNMFATYPRCGFSGKRLGTALPSLLPVRLAAATSTRNHWSRCLLRRQAGGSGRLT